LASARTFSYDTELVFESPSELGVCRQRAGPIAAFRAQLDQRANGFLAPWIEAQQLLGVLIRQRAFVVAPAALDQLQQELDLSLPESAAPHADPIVVVAAQQIAHIQFGGLLGGCGFLRQPLELRGIDPSGCVRIPLNAPFIGEEPRQIRGRQSGNEVAKVRAQLRARFRFGKVRPKVEGDHVARQRPSAVEQQVREQGYRSGRHAQRQRPAIERDPSLAEEIDL
jgi:hypothetical protein